MGDLWTEAQLCLKMREAGVVVVDVNYRHCPGTHVPSPTLVYPRLTATETIWGKCIQDAWAALNWVRLPCAGQVHG